MESWRFIDSYGLGRDVGRASSRQEVVVRPFKGDPGSLANDACCATCSTGSPLDTIITIDPGLETSSPSRSGPSPPTASTSKSRRTSSARISSRATPDPTVLVDSGALTQPDRNCGPGIPLTAPRHGPLRPVQHDPGDLYLLSGQRRVAVATSTLSVQGILSGSGRRLTSPPPRSLHTYHCVGGTIDHPAQGPLADWEPCSPGPQHLGGVHDVLLGHPSEVGQCVRKPGRHWPARSRTAPASSPPSAPVRGGGHPRDLSPAPGRRPPGPETRFDRGGNLRQPDAVRRGTVDLPGATDPGGHGIFFLETGCRAPKPCGGISPTRRRDHHQRRRRTSHNLQEVAESLMANWDGEGFLLDHRRNRRPGSGSAGILHRPADDPRGVQRPDPAAPVLLGAPDVRQRGPVPNDPRYRGLPRRIPHRQETPPLTSVSIAGRRIPGKSPQPELRVFSSSAQPPEEGL